MVSFERGPKQGTIPLFVFSGETVFERGERMLFFERGPKISRFQLFFFFSGESLIERCDN